MLFSNRLLQGPSLEHGLPPASGIVAADQKEN